MAQGLVGKTAVITGAGRGIGRANALLLAEHGMNIVAAARSEDELAETRVLVVALGADCLTVRTDVTVETDCDALIAASIERFGAIDLLVNNAGAAKFAPVWELTTEEFELNLGANLRGLFWCSRAAIKAMIPRRSGRIITIASSSGKKPYPTQGAYCAAKAGAIALTKVMAMELREHGISAHCVCPGGVVTRLADEIHPTRDKTGWIQPEDVAEAVLYLTTLPAHVAVDEIAIRRFAAEPL